MRSGENAEKIMDRFREQIEERDADPEHLVSTLDVGPKTIQHWIDGEHMPRQSNLTKIRKWLKGELDSIDSIDRGCRIRGCEFPPAYEYHNPHSGAEGSYCTYHMDTRRSDMDASDWIDRGYASVIDSCD